MRFFDSLKFKKKKEAEQTAARPVADKATGADGQRPPASPADQGAPSTKTEGKTVPVKGVTRAHEVLIRPIISERSADLHSRLNQYVFEVHRKANKIEIKKAIKEMYDVDPISIRIVTVPGKPVTRGQVRGRTNAYKKAIIAVPKGTELPVYEGV